jgi:hypothetical protein
LVAYVDSIAIWPLSMGNFWLTILDAVLLFINAFFNYFVISQVRSQRLMGGFITETTLMRTLDCWLPSQHPSFSQNPTVYDVNEVRVDGGNDNGYNNNGGYVPTQQI